MAVGGAAHEDVIGGYASAQATTAVPMRERAAGRRETMIALCRDVLIPFVVTRLALFLVGLLAAFYAMPLVAKNLTLYSTRDNTHLPDALWLMWHRFDAGFYSFIAAHGYYPASTLKQASDWVFYPLYPWLARPFAWLLGGGNTAYLIGGLIASNLAALIGCIYLYLLVRREFGDRVAGRSVLFLLLYPMSFYLSANSSESTLLATSVAALYYARERRWWLAGLCGGLAALSRLQGVFVVVPLAWELWQALSDHYAPLPLQADGLPRHRQARLWVMSRLRGPVLAARNARNWLALAALALVPLGTFLFMVYTKVHTGSWLAAFHNSQLWGRQTTAPWQVLLTSLQHPEIADPGDWNFWIFNNIVALVFLIFMVWALLRLPMIYGLYAVVTVLAPLSSGEMNNIGRYLVVSFPTFLLLALWTSRKQDARQGQAALVTTFFAMIQAAFMVLYVLGVHSMA